MRKILPVLMIPLLAACQSLPPAGEDWIEVPLAANTWWEATTPYKETLYRIPVAAGDSLEHMLSINEGDFVVYELRVQQMDDPSLLGVEFHGHTDRVGDAPGTLMFYKIHADGHESGVLRAPFSGTHGWYLNNQSNEDVEVVLNVAGYFSD
jgi:hypothetical protein